MRAEPRCATRAPSLVRAVRGGVLVFACLVGHAHAAAEPGMVEAAGVATPHGRGILELNSRDTVLAVGGRIAMDTTIDWPAGSFAPGSVPVDDRGENGQLTAHLKESRLWLKTRSPVAWGMMQTLIEGDFYGSSGSEASTNGHGFRVRHAYLTVGGLTIGQTWSTFVPYATADTIMDAAFMSWIRQPQIRWTHRRGDRAYALALENPETLVVGPSGRQVAPGDDQVPDIVVRMTQDATWGRASLMGLARQIRQDHVDLGDGGGAIDGADAAVGWAAGSSVEWRLAGGDDIRAAAMVGDGIGRYLAATAFAAGTVDAQGEIRLQRAWGGYAAVRHWWSRTLRSTAAYSVARALDDMAGPSANREAASYQVNLFWTPFENGLFGLEYGRLVRERVDGQKGRMSRLYARTLFNF